MLTLPTTLDGADFSIGASGSSAPAEVSAPAQSVTRSTPEFSKNPFSRPFLQPADPAP